MNPRLPHARFAVFLCGCAAFLNLYATQSILPAFAESFQVSARQAGWSITVTTLAVALTAPFVGRLTARFEQRTVIAVAALLLAWLDVFSERYLLAKHQRPVDLDSAAHQQLRALAGAQHTG